MPMVTGSILARFASIANTTSPGLAASDFFAFRAVGGTYSAGLPGVGFAAVGNRVVTLWIGTVSTLVRERVSISAVTDIPGRNASLSATRIFTSNFGASDWEPMLLMLPLLPIGAPLAALAIAVTVPL